VPPSFFEDLAGKFVKELATLALPTIEGSKNRMFYNLDTWEEAAHSGERSDATPR
jgi:hypothetical protein